MKRIVFEDRKETGFYYEPKTRTTVYLIKGQPVTPQDLISYLFDRLSAHEG